MNMDGNKKVSFTKRVTTDHCLNVILAGKGGQGVILAGHVLLRSCLLKGLQAKRSEVHGMAQRGGSVVVHLRMGEAVHSPVIPYGQVHFIIGIDANEGHRWTPLLAAHGQLITLTEAETEALPHARFKNIATLSKFLNHLRKVTYFKNVLGSVLKSFSRADIENVLREKMSEEIVNRNMAVFEKYSN
ncbi:indolepyruvate ferredoxin oxidoreductase subunit beta [Spirochaetota bacterium]|nr:indolepyruvate ferredoxin oxidoreductase subunit beta [Spirochaetota bacterium]